MSDSSSITQATTIRIFKSQAEALKRIQLTKGASASALCRVLLQGYFDNMIPWADEALYKEIKRSTAALCSSQFIRS